MKITGFMFFSTAAVFFFFSSEDFYGIQPANAQQQTQPIEWTVDGDVIWADNCDYYEQDIAQTPNSRRENCGQICLTNLQCTHFTWTKDGKCWQKSWKGDGPVTGKVDTRCGFIRRTANNAIAALESNVADLTASVAQLKTQLNALQVQPQTARVSFHFQRPFGGEYNTKNWPISFEKTVTNIGNAMNGPTGTFKAPTAGIYYFVFTGVSKSAPLQLGVFINGIQITGSFTSSPSSFVTMPAIVPLNQDDIVQIKMIQGSMWDGSQNNRFINFMGTQFA